MRRSRTVWTIVVLLLTSAAAFGQGTTATLTGTVTTGGSALPGATVTVSSPAMQGTRATVTSEVGTYVLPALPPGDYTVKFELAGLQTIVKHARISLAQTTRVDAELRVSAVAEAITVTASAPATLETSQVATNFTAETINKLPVRHDILSAVALAPGVNTNGPANQTMISGAPSSDNVYLVNGVVVNENLRGQPHSLFVEDAIQETTVMSSGAISAEYGRFTGGVVSTITKSGGNEFSGSLRDSLSNAKWVAKTPYPGQPDQPDKILSIYEGTLGGYGWKDRLWFFGAGRMSRQVPTGTAVTTQRSTTAAKAGDPVFSYNNYNDEDRYEIKLTGRITDKHSIVGSYLNVGLTETNNAFTPIGDLDSIVATRELPNTLKALSYNGIITSNFLIEAQYSRKFFAFKGSGGTDTGFVGGTWVQDAATGIRYNAPVFCGVCTPEERNNDSWMAKGNYYLTTPAIGSHNIVAGVEQFDEQRIVNNYQSASQYQITTGRVRTVGTTAFPRFDSSTNFIYRPIFDLSQGTDLKTDSAFINDKWDLSHHLTFNLGVRYDKNNAHDSSGNLVSNDSAFSPRIGGIFDVQGNGRFRVNGSYARYVSKVADGNVGGSVQSAGSPAYFRYNYTGPAINADSTPDAQLVSMHDALQQMYAWFQGMGGFTGAKPNATSVPGYSSRFDKPINSPYVDEYNVGFGSQLTSSAFARVDLVHRKWGNFYAQHLDMTTGQVVDPYGNKGDQGVTTNSNDIQRKYQGVQAQAQWNHYRWLVGATYTWSKLQGSDEGEQQGTATVRNQPLALYYPEYLDYAQRLPYGYLNGDQRHRARAWANYGLPTPFGHFDLSLLQSYDTGQAYSAIAGVDATGTRAGNSFPNAPKNPGYTLSQVPSTANYYISKRGEFRTDDRSSTDLGVNYTVPVSRVSLFVQAQLINALNNAAVVDLSSSRIDTTVYTRRQRSTTTDGLATFVAFDPRTPPTQLKQYVLGVSDPKAGPYNYQLSSTFGQAVSQDAYQTPRTYRLSVGIRF